jgi:hypothetical protein
MISPQIGNANRHQVANDRHGRGLDQSGRHAHLVEEGFSPPTRSITLAIACKETRAHARLGRLAFALGVEEHTPASVRAKRERRALPLSGGVAKSRSPALADIIGARRVRTAAKKRLRGKGAWGPFKLERGAHYEFTISRSTSTHHLCFEFFQHDDDLIRLLTAEPDTGLDALRRRATGTQSSS